MRSESDLERFVEPQERVYQAVLQELRTGRKATHWMWFVFPQLRGLGRSATTQYYGIASAAEASAYLGHTVLGPRLRECVELVLAAHESTAHAIFGSPDDLKFHSSMTLFATVAPTEPLFRQALETYYGGDTDPLTLARLRAGGDVP